MADSKAIRVESRIPALVFAPPRLFRPSQFSSRPRQTSSSFPSPGHGCKEEPKRLKYPAPRFTKEGGLVYVEAEPSGEDSWKLDPIVQILKQAAVGVIPTDTLCTI
ncbi:unnamed protein product [Linum trigynum]|uniref:Uncharacterized protein n=1 Tax=Linum trigynum TaxID=586398 RepID=A0AAV2F046_9ROSI